MPMIDDAWQGSVQFWELVFGTWLAYIVLVLMWEKALLERLDEWRYILITFLGVSFYWINHYFQHAPFYLWLLEGYTAMVWVAYYMIAVRGRGSLVWTIVAALSMIPFIVAFILFEQLARYLLQNYGVQEFWFMLASYFGFIGLILWRRSATARQPPATP